MGKYLIISDIHLKHKTAQRIIDSVEHDLVIFLGDAFHDFGDTPEVNAETAQWMKAKLYDPNFIWIWGNHDIVTAFPSDVTYCSGWTPQKQAAIDEIITPEEWTKVVPFYYIKEGNWLLSHAGVSRHIFECPSRGLTLGAIKEKCELGLAHIAYKQYAPEFGAGFDRGGRQEYGGITWGSFENLTPIKEFRQICAHTPSWTEPQVRFMNNKGGIFQQTYHRFKGWDSHPEIAVDLDTHLRHYAVLENGSLTIFENQSQPAP